jgi:hypothetical protein
VLKNKIKLIIFVIFLNGSNFCFSQILGDHLSNPKWEYYSENLLSTVSAGKGCTGVGSLGDLSFININPACISLEDGKNYQVYAGATVKTNIAVFSNNPAYHVSSGFPSVMLGGIYKLSKDFYTGFVYYNDFSFADEYNSSSHKDISRFATHSFTVPVIYNKGFIRFGAYLSVVNFRGFISGLYTTAVNPEGYYSEAHSELWKIMSRFGAYISPVDCLSFGLTYSPGFTDKNDWFMDGSSVKYASNNVYHPDRFGAGAECRVLNNKLKFSCDYIFSRTSSLEYLRDRNNFHFGIEYLKDKDITLRCGMFTLFDFRKMTNDVIIWSEAADAYRELFLTAGGSYKFRNFVFNIAVMDSHFIKSNVSHTKFNGSILLNL